MTPQLIEAAKKEGKVVVYSAAVGSPFYKEIGKTFEAKYGIRNWQGGGRSSARETVGRVAAGVRARP